MYCGYKIMNLSESLSERLKDFQCILTGHETDFDSKNSSLQNNNTLKIYCNRCKLPLIVVKNKNNKIKIYEDLKPESKSKVS